MGMARKPIKYQQATIDDIRERAFRLFGRFGYDGVSIDNIASAAGLSKGALYWHFEGKQALYADCLSQLHDIFRERVFQPIDRTAGAREKLEQFFTGLGDILTDARVAKGLAGYWLESSSGRSTQIERVRRRFETEGKNVFVNMLREGLDSGEFVFDHDPDDVAETLFVIMQASTLPLRRRTNEEIRTMLTLLCDTFLSAYGDRVPAHAD